MESQDRAEYQVAEHTSNFVLMVKSVKQAVVAKSQNFDWKITRRLGGLDNRMDDINIVLIPNTMSTSLNLYCTAE